MDELKLNLTTNFMRGVVAKLIAKSIYKKSGHNIDILINQISVTAVDGKMRIHADVDGEISKDEFIKIIKSIGLD